MKQNLQLQDTTDFKWTPELQNEIFHVLQSDSTQYKPPSPKKRRRHSVDSCTPHSHNELSL